MISLLGLVAKHSGLTAQEVFWEMPLILVYSWEHYGYRCNGIDTKSLSGDNIEDAEGYGIIDILSKVDEDDG
jgi:hypothetical protein